MMVVSPVVTCCILKPAREKGSVRKKKDLRYDLLRSEKSSLLLLLRTWVAINSTTSAEEPEVIEQITYLLFLRRLDDLQINAENKARRFGTPVEHRVYPEGSDERGRPYE